MNRIEKAFEAAQPFLGYLTAGDGGFDYTLSCALAMVEGGVDILEIGFPFSDPVADGPVIQKAHERALAEGMTSSLILELARKIRAVSDVPLVLFSYCNPILQRGVPYLGQLKEAGYDAILIVDYPVPEDPEAPEPFFDAVAAAGLLPIVLATPSTSPERLQLISKSAKGFLYFVCQKGTTGIRNKLADDFAFHMKRLKSHFHLPVVAGFGIADRASAKAALEHADGFVVGSAFVDKISARIPFGELAAFARSIDPRLGKDRRGDG